jgi:hypothetical protein
MVCIRVLWAYSFGNEDEDITLDCHTARKPRTITINSELPCMLKIRY